MMRRCVVVALSWVSWQSTQGRDARLDRRVTHEEPAHVAAWMPKAWNWPGSG